MEGNSLRRISAPPTVPQALGSAQAAKLRGAGLQLRTREHQCQRLRLGHTRRYAGGRSAGADV